MNARVINKTIMFMSIVLFFLSAGTAHAIQIKLNNGTVLIGDIISQDESSIVVQVGPSRLSIAKSMVTEIAGLRVGASAAAPAQQASAAPRLDVSAVTPGKKVEITLKNGTKFKGIVTAADDRLITLEMASGSRIDFYKSIIVDVGDLSSPSSTAGPAPAQVAQASVAAAPAAVSPAQSPAPSLSRTASAGVSLGAGAAVSPGKKIEITLNNGSRFKGTVMAADDRLVTLEGVGGSRLSFYRTSILDISDLSQPSSQPSPAPVVQSSSTAVVPPVPAAVAPAQTPPAGVSPASAGVPIGIEAVAPGKTVEIMLKNGSKFKGNVTTADEHLITLEMARGSRVDFYKSIIAAVSDLALPQAPSSPQVNPAPSAPSYQTAAAAVTPAADRASSMPSAAPASPVTPPAPPAVTAVTSTVAVAQQKRQDMVPPPVAPQPVAPPSVPVVQAQLASAPAAILPAQQAAPLTAAAVVPKGSEGKNELVLKNGTVFRGAIVSANNRFITFSNSDGMSVNILRRFIKTVDGAPSAAPTGTPLAYADTTAQVQTTGSAAAEAPEKSGAIAELLKQLYDTSGDVRKKAVADLGAVMDPAALPPLCSALKDRDPAVRKAAATALGDLRDVRAIAPLCAALQEEPVDSVKAAAAFSLKLHTEIPLLIGVLDSKDNLVRENAAYILWLMTGKNFGNDKQSWVDWYSKGQ